VYLPDWLVKYERTFKDKEFQTEEEMMEVAVEISARNMQEGTGGPFGSAIFRRNKSSGTIKLLATGCNRVVPLNNSTLHGEMTAIMFAEKRIGSYSLESTEKYEYILCTSCEPCCMCLGGTMWSGVAELLCAGTKDDAERIGFNEGPVFDESYKQLEAIGMKIKKRVLHAKAASVLEQYGKTGVIY
jgi:tRNA(Arg) A34 adenosine deaminase TadA